VFMEASRMPPHASRMPPHAASRTGMPSVPRTKCSGEKCRGMRASSRWRLASEAPAAAAAWVAHASGEHLLLQLGRRRRLQGPCRGGQAQPGGAVPLLRQASAGTRCWRSSGSAAALVSLSPLHTPQRAADHTVRRVFKQSARLKEHVAKKHAEEAGLAPDDGASSSTAPPPAAAAAAAGAQQGGGAGARAAGASTSAAAAPAAPAAAPKTMEVGSKAGYYTEKSPKMLLHGNGQPYSMCQCCVHVCREGVLSGRGGGDSLPTRDCCTVAEWCLRSKRPRPKYKALPAVKEDGSSQQSTGSLLKCRVSGCAGPTCWPGPLQAWSPAVLCAQWQSAVRALRDSVSPAERRHQGAACPRHTAHHQHIT